MLTRRSIFAYRELKNTTGRTFRQSLLSTIYFCHSRRCHTLTHKIMQMKSHAGSRKTQSRTENYQHRVGFRLEVRLQWVDCHREIYFIHEHGWRSVIV